MKHAVILTLAMSASIPCAAQESGQYRSCQAKAGTQLDMTMCASEEAKRVDGELNRVYRALVSQESDPSAVAKIKAAEEAWIRYRDAYIEAMWPAKDKQAEYGTVYPMQVNLVRARLTRRQVDALKALAE